MTSYGVNEHFLAWTAPADYPLTELTELGTQICRNDLPMTGGSYTGTFGSAQCLAGVAALSKALRSIGVQPMIVVTNNTLPETASSVAGITALCKAVPGLWIEWGNEIDGKNWDAPSYVAQFAEIVAAVKAADPSAKIGPAPVSNINPNGGGAAWTAKCAAAGLFKIPFDFLPFHNYPYPSDESPVFLWTSQGAVGGYSAVTLIPWWSSYVKSLGSTAPDWMTEFGWQSSDGTMTIGTQSAFMQSFLTEIEPYNLPVAVGYELGDGGEQTYGWMTAGWAAKKPVFTAVQNFITVPPTPPTPPTTLTITLSEALPAGTYTVSPS